MNRVRAALLRLAPPWRRRHPVILARVGAVEIHSVTGVSFAATATEAVTAPVSWHVSSIDANAAAERDPTDEAGA